MLQQICNHQGDVLFHCELPDYVMPNERVRYALEQAVQQQVSLRDAVLDYTRLARVGLAGADLEGASFVRAELDKADLSGANICGADFTGATMEGANLSGVNAVGAIFSRAVLNEAKCAGANLCSAYFDNVEAYFADFTNADITEACITRADFSGGLFSGAKYDGLTLKAPPIFIGHFTWDVIIFDSDMQIGCELHSLHDWETFTDEYIIFMGGKQALRFWRSNKTMLLDLARNNGASFEPFDTAGAAK